MIREYVKTLANRARGLSTDELREEISKMECDSDIVLSDRLIVFKNVLQDRLNPPTPPPQSLI